MLTGLRRDRLALQQPTPMGDDYLVEMTQFDLVPEQVQLYLDGLCKGLIAEETIPEEAIPEKTSPEEATLNPVQSVSPRSNA